MSGQKYVPPHLRGKITQTATLPPPIVAQVVTSTVKVGLDQWVVVGGPENGRQVDLCTDGLSGCVALVLLSDRQASLAHVYSDCDSEAKWVGYKHQLDLIKIVMDKVSKVTEGATVVSDGTGAWLRNHVLEWIAPYVGKLSMLAGSGVRVTPLSSGGWCIIPKEQDPRRANGVYLHGYLTTANANLDQTNKRIVNWGGLSSDASVAS